MLGQQEILFLGCVFASFPLAYLHIKIKDVTQRHIYSIFCGVLFAVLLFQTQVIHSFIAASVTYLICKYNPAKCQWIVFAWALGYLAACHIYRQYIDYLGWSLDFTTPQMMLTWKLISLGFNVNDGHKKANHPKQVNTLPSPLEYFSYVYHFGSFLAGPFNEFTDYKFYIENYPKLDAKGTELPYDWKLPLSRVAFGLIFGVIHLVLGNYCYASFLIDPTFLAWPFVRQIVYMHLTAIACRSKYYFGWYLAEGALLAGGFGFNGFDSNGQALWDKYRGVNPIACETAQNTRVLIAEWNKTTAYFLREYVNNRVKFISSNPLATIIATYTTSAFWHGFYPGYYLFFGSTFIAGYAATEFRRTFRPYLVSVDPTDPKKEIVKNAQIKLVYDIITAIATQGTNAYCSSAFMLLAFSWSIQMYVSMYFIGHLLFLSVIALCFVWNKFVAPKPKRARTDDKKPKGE